MTLTLASLMVAACASGSPAACAEVPPCEIVVAWDRQSRHEIVAHEIAHCNGWVHADQKHKGKPLPGYKSPKPPSEFAFDYPGELIIHRVSTDQALRRCGSYGCALIGNHGKRK